MPVYHTIKRIGYRYKRRTEYIWVVGDTKKPKLLLIPGLTGIHSNLLEFSYKLRNDYFLIFPDLPGWGDSPRFDAKLTLTNYARYLDDLLGFLGLESVNLWGHCMGAALAIEFTYLYPRRVKKLILVSPPYEEGQMGFHLMRHMSDIGIRSPHIFHPIFYFWKNRYLNFFLGFFIMKFRSFRRKTKWLIRKLLLQKTQDEQAFDETWVNLMHFNYRKIRDIKVPIHLIFGAQDLLISNDQARKLHSMVSQATLDFIEKGGHVTPVETPDTLAHLTYKYLVADK